MGEEVDGSVEVLSTAELEAALDGMVPGDWTRLRKLAHYLAMSRGGEADDLVQEALTRSLEGRRRCPKGLSIVKFLSMVMRSLASEVSESRKKGLVPVAVSGEVFERVALDMPSPEAATISKIDGGAMLQRVEAAVDGDDELGFLLMGIGDGMKGVSLQGFVGLDAKGLASAQRRLQRRLCDLKAERASA
jgi:hypothetical protein